MKFKQVKYDNGEFKTEVVIQQAQKVTLIIWRCLSM